MSKNKLSGILFSIVATLSTAALAGATSLPGDPPAVEDVAFGQDVAWAAPLEDEALSEMRGAAGLMFSVFFTSELEFNQPASAPEGLAVTQPADNMVQITGGLGNFGGANGIFQFTNVEGSMNVVNNSMVINVAIVNSSTPNLSTLFSGMR